MPSPKQKFERFFSDADFDMDTDDTDITVTNGQFTKVGEHIVSAQQEIAFGVGEISNGVDSRKNSTIRIDGTTGGQIFGTIRLAIANATETDIRIIQEDLASNYDDGVELAETTLRAGEDSRLQIYLNPNLASSDTAGGSTTVDMSDANTSIAVPVTVYQ